MCGIAGFVLRGSSADQSVIRKMCAEIRHRGPDDEGLMVRDNWAIGMRRLSIIDLAGGHQPMSNEDDSIWIVFNGEIYDYRSLRHELQQSGHKFKTESDTEVILHLYEQEGVQGFARLRGMSSQRRFRMAVPEKWCWSGTASEKSRCIGRLLIRVCISAAK